MPEPEELISDVARHATIYARELWHRHRKNPPLNPSITLQELAQRLDLLIAAVFGTSYVIKVAQAPAPPTLLTKVFRRDEGPRVKAAIPATDGASIWLPARLPIQDRHLALEHYRVLALQQAMRAHRGSPVCLAHLENELQRATYAVLEARACDAALEALLPGMQTSLERFRELTLHTRPPVRNFPACRRPFEEWVRTLLSNASPLPASASPAESVALALTLAEEFAAHAPDHSRNSLYLLKDLWTGDLLSPPVQIAQNWNDADGIEERAAVRSARLPRRPEVRNPAKEEDDKKQGGWMVQTSQPHEQAEDPVGMQRPTDRDETSAAEEFADALSELPEARLVSTPGRPREVLLSDDTPASRAKRHAGAATSDGSRLAYPEWDCRAGAYRDPGATIHLLAPQSGPQQWVNRTLDAHRSMLAVVRRRFEMLRAQRLRLRKQLEGEEIDLQAYIDNHADFRAGLPMSQALYQRSRPMQRDMAIVLLIDMSGSTDSWISTDKRVIDIEREALLLVSIALQGMAQPSAVMAFSGVGPHAVTVRTLKSFDEPYDNEIARRIAALEPEHYTRAGAAIRHATAVLMRQSAHHRLLLLLSDGKPNDIDDYEGRYGVEDMRQAVTEAKLQGISPFCLTIDRQAANYLPRIFGVHHYALLPKPELLPTVLLEWMKRLISA